LSGSLLYFYFCAYARNAYVDMSLSKCNGVSQFVISEGRSV